VPSNNFDKRHPAQYIHRRYETVIQLMAMGAPSKQMTVRGDGDEVIVEIFRMPSGFIKIGVIAPVADLLRKYPQPKVEFFAEIMRVLHHWKETHGAFRGCSEEFEIGREGIVAFHRVGEMAKLVVTAEMERFIAQQKYLAQIHAYRDNFGAYLMGQRSHPERKRYGITNTDAKNIRSRLFQARARYSHGFDPRKVRIV
jgi:hypothetical protein